MVLRQARALRGHTAAAGQPRCPLPTGRGLGLTQRRPPAPTPSDPTPSDPSPSCPFPVPSLQLHRLTGRGRREGALREQDPGSAEKVGMRAKWAAGRGTQGQLGLLPPASSPGRGAAGVGDGLGSTLRQTLRKPQAQRLRDTLEQADSGWGRGRRPQGRRRGGLGPTGPQRGSKRTAAWPRDTGALPPGAACAAQARACAPAAPSLPG